MTSSARSFLFFLATFLDARWMFSATHIRLSLLALLFGTLSLFAAATAVAQTVDPVTNLTATAGDGKLTVTWTNPSSATAAPADHFPYIRWRVQNTNSWLNSGGEGGRGVGGSLPSSHEITNLMNGTTYEVGIRIFQGSISTFSSWVSTTGTPRAPLPTVSLSAPDSVTEGTSAWVLVELSEPSAYDRTFWLTLRRDTAEANDLLAEPWPELSRGGGHVFIIKNGKIGSFEIPTYQDDDTDDERFTVALDTTENRSMHGLEAGSPISLTITIRDDDTDDNNGGVIVPPPPTNQPPPGPPRVSAPPTGGGPSPGGGGSPPATPSDPAPDSPCGESDREYLERFYEMTDGEGWDRDDNWRNSEEPLEEWFGVGTEDGRVISLLLPDNSLSGKMPEDELLCLTELKELALWGNDDLSGEVTDELALPVERAALREIAKMLDINPEWFENYEDPYDFEDWHAGVTTDEDGRVIELDLPGEVPETIISELRKLRVITTSSEGGGCALSPKDDSSAFGLFLLTLLVFAVLVRKRARG